MPFDIGKLAGQKPYSYRLLALLGQGGFGAVYKARVEVSDKVVGAPIAVKILTRNAVDWSASLNELEAAGQLEHPGLIKFTGHPGEARVRDDAGNEGDIYYFAMELAEGSLYDRIVKSGPLGEAELRSLIQPVATALQYLHENRLVHRDLKPGNLLTVQRRGWVIGDLGLARPEVDGYYSMAGTELYRSPEFYKTIFTGKTKPKSAWDIWALGLVLLEAAQGKPLAKLISLDDWVHTIVNPSPMALPGGLPGWLMPIIQGCLEKDATKRWTAAQVLEGLKGKAASIVLSQPYTVLVPAQPKPAPSPPPQASVEVLEGTWAQPKCVFRDRARDGGSNADFPQMVIIPAGTFMMGSENGRDSEKPVHPVPISRPFALGRYPVTQREWQALIGSNPSNFKGGRNPVENVSWNDTNDFILKLNQRCGHSDKTGYRLPSEAEWEYACRAGSTGEYCFGDDEGKLRDYAWFSGNSADTTHPVGEKYANESGLSDMHGNVWEWVEDVWHNKYQGAPVGGSAWTTGSSNSARVLRGGSWGYNPRNVRSATRGSNAPDVRGGNIGFRVARTLFPES